MAKNKVGLWHLGGGNYYAFSKERREKGEKIMEFEGEIVPTYLADPRRSLQLTGHFSFEWPLGSLQHYLRHSCDPNCYLDFSTGIPVLTARRYISAGQEVRYDYNTVELTLNTRKPFNCLCGATRCVDLVQGFMYLTPAQEKDLDGQLSPYIKEMQAEFESSREPFA